MQKTKEKYISYTNSDLIQQLLNFYTSEKSMGFDIMVIQPFFMSALNIGSSTKKIFQNFPSLEPNLEMFVSDKRNYGSVQFIEVNNRKNKDLNKIIFANMICNKPTSLKRKIDYILLAKCFFQISAYVKNQKQNANIDIWTNRFTSKYLGGNWSFVEQMMSDAWIKNNILVFN